MSNNTTPTVEQLQRAVEIAQQIQTLQAELHGILGKTGKIPKIPGFRAPLSPEARERIAAAQRRRWAKYKAQNTPEPGKKRRMARRNISAESRERMAQAARNRWIAVRRQKEQPAAQQPAPEQPAA